MLKLRSKYPADLSRGSDILESLSLSLFLVTDLHEDAASFSGTWHTEHLKKNREA